MTMSFSKFSLILRRISLLVLRDWADVRSASLPISLPFWQDVSISMPRQRRRGSYDSATPSTFLSSLSKTCQDFFRAPLKNLEGSFATEPSYSTPSPKQQSRRSQLL